jgi:dolichol-phosphate mannosyltransferase
MNDVIIIVPTLNEKENIKILFNKLTETNIGFDLLFIDDNSYDGSQAIIKDLVKKNQNINYIFRAKKMGIGSAHKDGLTWSYNKKYKTVITMDSDGTHDPKYLPFLIKELKNFDIIVTNRFLEKNSLEGWPLFRVFLTTLRHLTISLLLSMPYDSSGAFRCINCRKVGLSDLILAKNDSYSYFWESIFILHKKKYRIGQVPVQLPFRKIGSSKMNMKDIFFSIYYLMIVFLKKILGKYNFK